nr:bifunctional 5,10-methylenetetrahydrofolate dehydrogenase/5,10-methenyltetrahydrofolate cyclohydrolase [Candidatus Burarchaeum sp.]
MAVLIDGKKMAGGILEEVKKEVAKLKGRPCLAVILVGEDPASKIYVTRKSEACREAGIEARDYRLPAETSEKELLELVDRLNKDKGVNGILVQMPMPKHINENLVTGVVSSGKDVDGLAPENIRKLGEGGAEGFAPATPLGVMEMLRRLKVRVKGKRAVVIGRSALVGRPVAAMLRNAGAEVMVCHSKTPDVGAETMKADILVVAVGKPKLVTGDMVKKGVVVIDVGTNRLPDGKLVGDVDFDSVRKKASMITPVPGGVGPMTIALLLKNVVKAYRMQGGK